MQPNTQNTESRKTTALTIISAIILILAVAITSLAAYLWQQERYTTESLRERISELETGGSTAPDDSTAAPALCENNTARYTAEVGRFTLTLADNDYVIIKNHDGAGEGGDATRVSVGKCLNAADNTVRFETNEQLTVNATPNTNWAGTSFAEWVTGRVEASGGPSTELAATTVAGAPAREFSIDGLGQTRKIFFEQNDIWYEIEVYNTEGDSSAAMQMRSDVIAGFSFTE